jgi:hypothetical protein
LGPHAHAQDLSAGGLRHFVFRENAEGVPVLFRRRSHVVLSTFGLEEQARVAAVKMAAAYALASDVKLDVSGTGANLVVYRAPDINVGDRINTKILEGMNLPPDAVAAVAGTTGWSSGCGAYQFSHPEGSISLALVLIDEGLSAAKAATCLATGMGQAFGLNIDPAVSGIFQYGYFQFPYLLHLGSACEHAYRKSGRSKAGERDYVISCVDAALSEHFAILRK